MNAGNLRRFAGVTLSLPKGVARSRNPERSAAESKEPRSTLSAVEGLPHTFACSTIGPAGLNLRRLEGVSAAAQRQAEDFCRSPERSEGSLSAMRYVSPGSRPKCADANLGHQPPSS